MHTLQKKFSLKQKSFQPKVPHQREANIHRRFLCKYICNHQLIPKPPSQNVRASVSQSLEKTDWHNCPVGRKKVQIDSYCQGHRLHKGFANCISNGKKIFNLLFVFYLFSYMDTTCFIVYIKNMLNVYIKCHFSVFLPSKK